MMPSFGCIFLKLNGIFHLTLLIGNVKYSGGTKRKMVKRAVFCLVMFVVATQVP